MVLTNAKIYDYALKLTKGFKGDEVFPIKFNFYLQKNIKTIVQLAQEIDESRIKVGQIYGIYDEKSQTYTIKDENKEIAEKEYSEMMDLKQNVEIYSFKLDELPEDMQLSVDQLKAIEFMIEEPESE